MFSKSFITSAAFVALLAGCSSNPAGYMENNQFGYANENNVVAQAAYAYADRRLIAMDEKFRASANNTVLFDFDSAVLDDEARQVLDGQIAWLNQNEEVRMRVMGYTDKVGTEAYNDRLGLSRARAVVRYMTEQGVDPSRLDAVVSRGENDPVVDTDQRERQNRRSVTIVAGFKEGFVGDGFDGKRAVNNYNAYVGDNEKPLIVDNVGG